MKRLFISLIACIFFLSLSVSPLYAADIRSGQNLSLDKSQTNLSDLYLFGQDITVDAPVTNDLVAAGGTVRVNGDVTGGVLAAGGDLNINGTVNGSVRMAGGTLTLAGTVDHDVAAVGGNILIDKNAAVNGDLLAMGGKLDVEGPIKGNIHVNGGQVRINSTIDGNVQGNMGSLTLGPNAHINGHLEYKAAEKATVASGATVKGGTKFTQTQQHKAERGARALFSGLALYNLLASIIFGIIVIWLLSRFLASVFGHIDASPVGTGLIGLVSLIVIPLLCVILLILIFPGIIGFLFYGLLLFLSGVVASLYVGYLVMGWWERRNNHVYRINWLAAVVGPIVIFLISLIPILGGLVNFILFLLALGGITKELLHIREHQQLEPAPAPSRSVTSRPARATTTRSSRSSSSTRRRR